MLPELTCEELAAGLDAVAMEVLAKAGVEGPPIDAFRVAARLGITVALDDRQAGRARYVRLEGRRTSQSKATILLRPDPRQERRQWALAHEIGEHVAHRVFAVWGADPCETSPQAREEVANNLAGRLLLPGLWFMAHGIESGWDLFELKSRYSTASHELIARRMLECGPPVIVTIFDQGAIYLRRSNVVGRTPPVSATEQRCWRTVHEQNCPEQAYDGLCKIRAWPVHEEGWRREILCTEVDEWSTEL